LKAPGFNSWNLLRETLVSKFAFKWVNLYRYTEGFVVAAVCMVFASQTPAMLGAKAVGPMSGHFATAAVWLYTHPMSWHPGTAALAATTFAIMLNGTKIHKMFPSALLCCLLGGGLMFAGVDVGTTVGAISLNLGGIFPPAALKIDPALAKALIVPGIAIGITTYLEGAAVCKRWADEDGDEWDSNRELVAQGVSNLCSAAVGGMPVSGVISRAAFGKTSGATTRLAHGVTGAMIIVFLVSGGGALLGLLPKAVLGALVGCGVMPLCKPTVGLCTLNQVDP
jgi:SulP family sulfate permease